MSITHPYYPLQALASLKLMEFSIIILASLGKLTQPFDGVKAGICQTEMTPALGASQQSMLPTISCEVFPESGLVLRVNSWL